MWGRKRRRARVGVLMISTVLGSRSHPLSWNLAVLLAKCTLTMRRSSPFISFSSVTVNARIPNMLMILLSAAVMAAGKLSQRMRSIAGKLHTLGWSTKNHVRFGGKIDGCRVIIVIVR